MAELTHLPPDTTLMDVLDIIHRDGGVIVDDLLPENVLAQVETELRPYLDAAGGGQNEFTGFSTQRIGALIARSPICCCL